MTIASIQNEKKNAKLIMMSLFLGECVSEAEENKLRTAKLWGIGKKKEEPKHRDVLRARFVLTGK